MNSQSLLSKKDCDYIKRPANSFMIWAQTYRKKVFEDNTTLNNAEISKLLGQQWKTLSNEEKQIYKDKAEQVKQEQNQKSSDTPSLDQNENFSKISRKEALSENKRIELNSYSDILH